jgi:hypothetical protein
MDDDNDDQPKVNLKDWSRFAVGTIALVGPCYWADPTAEKPVRIDQKVAAMVVTSSSVGMVDQPAEAWNTMTGTRYVVTKPAPPGFPFSKKIS